MMPGRFIPAGRAHASVRAEPEAMPVNAAKDDPEKARRFREAALPHLDDVYPLARYLLRDAATVRRLVSALAEPFRETFVLREINNLSYREIANAVGAPVGTVMSRLARARAMLRTAWTAEEEQPR